LFTVRTYTNSNNSYSLHVITSLIDESEVQTSVNHIFHCYTTQLFKKITFIFFRF